MNKSKIVIGLGVMALGGYFLLKDKATKLSEQFKNISILPVEFKNLDAKWNDGKPYVSFNLDLKFINPTDENFNANGVVITLKRLLFYDKNSKLLGGSNINVNALNIPAKSSIILPNVPIVLDLQTTLINIINIIKAGNFSANTIKIEAIISVLGLEYKLSQK